MYPSVNDYLSQLRVVLKGCDTATLQDALADAEDHLRLAVGVAKEGQPGLSEEQALEKIVEEYGSPEEVGAAYREIERRLPPALAPAAAGPARPFWERFLGVVVDPRAWGALLYMLISLLTGILYFTWAVTGLSLSAGLVILIIGLPFTLLFLLSVRGIALVEGRIVEALLGVRMPRRAIFVDQTRGFWNRVKELVLSWLTWKTMIYLVLMLPLGIIYFSVFISLLTVSLALVAVPFLQIFIHVPLLMINGLGTTVPVWSSPLWVLGGGLLVVLTMHFARLVGRLQGSFAKWMLVG